MDDDSCGREGGKQNSVNDVETGAVAPDNSVQTKSQFAYDKDDSEYTHVLIPRLLGNAIADSDRHIKGSEDCHMEIQKKRRGSYLTRKMFVCVSKVGQEVQDINEGERGSKVKKTNHVQKTRQGK